MQDSENKLQLDDVPFQSQTEKSDISTRVHDYFPRSNKNCNLAQIYFLKLSALTQLSSCIILLDVEIGWEAKDLSNCYCNF